MIRCPFRALRLIRAEKHGISWCGWSLCDKSETSAALNPGTSPDRAWTEEDLSPSGKLMFEAFGE